MRTDTIALPQAPGYKMSPQRKRLCRLFVETGGTNAAMAAALNSTAGSIGNLMWRLMTETGARNRTELLLILQTPKWLEITRASEIAVRGTEGVTKWST